MQTQILGSHASYTICHKRTVQYEDMNHTLFARQVPGSTPYIICSSTGHIKPQWQPTTVVKSNIPFTPNEGNFTASQFKITRTYKNLPKYKFYIKYNSYPPLIIDQEEWIILMMEAACSFETLVSICQDTAPHSRPVEFSLSTSGFPCRYHFATALYLHLFTGH